MEISKRKTRILYHADKVIKRIPLEMAEKFSNITPLIPFYHLVTHERLPHVCHLYHYKNEGQFVSDIDFLCKRYQPVSLPDIINHVRGVGSLKKGSFLLTFDDGYSQMYSVVAPILNKKGIPAVFFLSTDFIDNRALNYRNKASLLIEHMTNHEAAFRMIRTRLPMSLNLPVQEVYQRIRSVRYQETRILDDIAELMELSFHDYLLTVKPFLSSEQIFRMIEMGFFIGAHSIDHPLYADLELEEQLAQTIGSLQILENKFHLPYSVFAFPHSDHAVTRKFFEAIANHADLTFGTSGPKIDIIKSNLQRIDFEKTLEPAKDILARELIKKRIFKWIHRSGISRV